MRIKTKAYAPAILLLSGLAVAGFTFYGNALIQDDAAAQMMANCPRHVEGTTIQVTEVANGFALTFTTTKGDVEELRSRVQMMAKMHNSGQGMMKMHSAEGSGGMMQHMHSMHGMKNNSAEKSEKPQEKGETEKQMGAHSGGHQMMNGGQQKSGMGMMHGKMGSMMSDQNSSHMMTLPEAEIAYETVPDGARLTFTPENKAESAALLDRLTHYAEMMNGGTCMQLQMMKGMMSQSSDGQSDTGMQQGTGHAGHHE